MEIETDFRKILKILDVFANPEYEPDEQWLICLGVLYKDFDFDNLPPNSVIEEMQKKAAEFIDAGIKDDGTGRKKPKVVDWIQDAPIMAGPISKVLGRDVRSPEPTHWWTFLSAYMDIGESLFSNIINIRTKLANHKKLEDYEKEFYKNNKSLIDLQVKKAERSEEEKNELRKLFGFK